MPSPKKIQPVPPQFIQRGIEKYSGEVDESLKKHLEHSDCAFVPYRFADGRYLLVQPETNFAFLYPDLETVYEKLVLD
jgi:hypothetical protein